MRVLHVSPSYFHDSSRIGGGERFSFELARAMARRVPTEYVSFSARPATLRVGELTVQYLPARRFIQGQPDNPVGWSVAAAVARADIVHCHGHPCFVSDLCLVVAGLLRRPVFMTDMGGGGPCPSTYLARLGIDTRRFYRGLLLLSQFNAQVYPRHRERVRIIYGGVDPERFPYRPDTPRTRFLFVGRLVPVKGVNVLIQAVTERTPLRVVGRPYDAGFHRELLRLAEGRPVEFDGSCPDERLPEEYARAIATILPSVTRDMFGRPVACRGELLGLVLLESMACGTPVICTNTGGMPEIVEDGVTGFIVPENDSEALRERMEYLAADRETAARMGRAGYERVRERFTWDRVAERCLAAYEELGRRAGAAVQTGAAAAPTGPQG